MTNQHTNLHKPWCGTPWTTSFTAGVPDAGYCPGTIVRHDVSEYSRVDLASARAWIADCFSDAPEDLDEMEVADAMRRHYVGGMAAFIADGGY